MSSYTESLSFGESFSLAQFQRLKGLVGKPMLFTNSETGARSWRWQNYSGPVGQSFELQGINDDAMLVFCWEGEKRPAEKICAKAGTASREDKLPCKWMLVKMPKGEVINFTPLDED